MMKSTITLLVLGLLVGCGTDAQLASRNLSKSAEMFEINRRVVFINGITDSVMLTMEGRCSIEDQSKQLEVTCKVSETEYMKHFLGLSDNVTYIAEQLETSDVSVYHYRRIYKPQTLIPDVDFRVSAAALVENPGEQ